MAAHVAVRIPTGGRRFGSEMDLAAGRHKVARQGTGRCQKHIFGAIGVGIRRYLVIKQFRHETPSADIFIDQIGR